MANMIMLLFFILLMVGLIGIILFVQLKLSRSENKFLGLILPLISFTLSLLMLLGWYSFRMGTVEIGMSSTSFDEETGEIIEEEEEIVEVIPPEKLNLSEFLTMGLSFIVTNIPTIILLGLYHGERNKLSMREDIEKMKTSDL